jgi:hypothetical protein
MHIPFCYSSITLLGVRLFLFYKKCPSHIKKLILVRPKNKLRGDLLIKKAPERTN